VVTNSGRTTDRDGSLLRWRAHASRADTCVLARVVMELLCQILWRAALVVDIPRSSMHRKHRRQDRTESPKQHTVGSKAVQQHGFWEAEVRYLV
jgi:hypothetical protein